MIRPRDFYPSYPSPLNSPQFSNFINYAVLHASLISP